jgi:hypothetical protein
MNRLPSQERLLQRPKEYAGLIQVSHKRTVGFQKATVQSPVVTFGIKHDLTFNKMGNVL